MRRFVFIMVLVCIVTLSCSSCSDNNSFDLVWNTDGSNLTDDQKSAIETSVQSFDFSGTVMVSLNGHSVYTTSKGYADISAKKEITSDSVFEIGSITKQFTATAIMMLCEQNKLNLDDTLSKFYADIPNSDKITIRNLLNMNSGIPNYTNTIAYDNMLLDTSLILSYDIDKNGLIELMSKSPSAFEPGSQFEYSNSNYFLLGCIIEKLTGNSYESYIEDNIFKPLDMTESTFDISNISTKGYDTKNNLEILPNKEMMFAAGQICSTTDNLNRWVNALLTKKLINDNSLSEMFTAVNGYGFGWLIKDDMFYHDGTTISYGSALNVDTKNNITVIVLTNILDDNIATRIANSISSSLSE